MSTSARAQQDVLVMPKFSRLMHERAFVFSRVSTLLLLVEYHASDALLYLGYTNYTMKNGNYKRGREGVDVPHHAINGCIKESSVTLAAAFMVSKKSL
jgi:hypothetical protein